MNINGVRGLVGGLNKGNCKLVFEHIIDFKILLVLSKNTKNSIRVH